MFFNPGHFSILIDKECIRGYNIIMTLTGCGGGKMNDIIKYKNGVYLFIENNVFHKLCCHEGTLYSLGDTTAEQELLEMLDCDFEEYREGCEVVSELSDLGSGDDFGTITQDQVDSVVEKALQLAIKLDTQSHAVSELLYAEVLNSTNITDDGTAHYFLDIMNSVNRILDEPEQFFYLVNRVISKCDTVDDFKTAVLTEKGLFRNSYPMEYGNHSYGDKELKLVEARFFDSFAQYYSFILLKFADSGKRLQLCPFCDRYFVPKTRKTTLYCDRVVTETGKTCKQVAPKIMQKLNELKDPLLYEYQKVKNRNYKRVQRCEDKLPEQRSEKDMTFEEYSQWLERVETARKKYLNGEISANEFKDCI